MAKRRSSRAGRAALIPERGPLRFDEKLVLNQWMLSLFGVQTFEQLAEPLRRLELEGLDEDNVHRFARVLSVQFSVFSELRTENWRLNTETCPESLKTES